MRRFTQSASALVLLAFVLALAGCQITPKAIDGRALKPNEGILALKTSSNHGAYMSFVEYVAVSTFNSRFTENLIGGKGAASFKDGVATYYMIPLPAGDYMWSRLDVSGGRYAWVQSTNRFRVVPGTITYVGDFRLMVTGDRFRLSVQDREADMRRYILDNFPAYSRAVEFTKSIADVNL